MIPAEAWLIVTAVSAGVALLAALAGTALLSLLGRRAVVVHLVVVSTAALATVAGAVLITTRLMFLSGHDARLVLVTVAVSGTTALGVALLLGRSLRAAGQALVGAAARLGDQTHDGVVPVPTAELRAVAIALDTAHHRLSGARAAAAAAETGRRDLVAGISHDLRTPLTGMRAMVEALEDGVVDDAPTVARYHHQLRVEIDRLAAMVSDLFELSRVEGPLQLNLQRVAAADLVDEAVASADPVARTKNLTLHAQSAPGLPVEVDTTEFGRVMRNLLLNAIRHTPADGSITVSAATGEGTVSFAVADACGGIPESDLPRVFQPAFRGDAARTTAADQGGGLGLAIARGIVEAHRGAIRVANFGPGCRFVVSLPVAPDRPH